MNIKIITRDKSLSAFFQHEVVNDTQGTLFVITENPNFMDLDLIKENLRAFI